MAILAAVAVIGTVAAAGATAYGAHASAKEAKKQEERRKRQAILEAMEDAGVDAGTGYKNTQTALEDIMAKNREVTGG